MVEYEKILGNLSSDLERGSGFSESAEIIAEVLSLVLIDKTNLEESKYKQIVQQNLKENPLLLYYTNIELLETVNPFFAQIIAEYWQEKLCSSGSNFAHLSRQEQEARDIILSLITSHRAAESHSGRQQQRFLHAATAETPRRSSQVPPMQDVANSNNMPSSQRCIVGKRVALATEAHLSQLPDLISMKTREFDLFFSIFVFVATTHSSFFLTFTQILHKKKSLSKRPTSRAHTNG